MTRREGGGPEWQPISTAPKDGTHVRGMWVHSHSTGKPLYWTADAGYVDSDGDFCYIGGDVTGWAADDYTHWMPLPPPPARAQTEGGEDG